MGKTNKKNSDDNTDKKWTKRQQKRLQATRNKKEKELELEIEEDKWAEYSYPLSIFSECNCEIE